MVKTKLHFHSDFFVFLPDVNEENYEKAELLQSKPLLRHLIVKTPYGEQNNSNQYYLQPHFYGI